MRKLMILACAAGLIATTPTDSFAAKHHWSRKAKGAAIGAGAGAVVGGVAHGGKGAAIGAAAGAGTGYLIGRHKDRKAAGTAR